MRVHMELKLFGDFGFEARLHREFHLVRRPQFDSVPESWMSYLAVDDVDARVKKAQSAGAILMRPIFDIPGVGRIAILKEPGGAGVGWMTPAKV